MKQSEIFFLRDLIDKCKNIYDVIEFIKNNK